MQREFGGYLPLELPHGQELYTGAGVLRLNCGRNAIVAALRDAGAKKVYLPYYNCNTVYDAVTRAGFAVERYPLDARRLPVCPALGDGEWLLYVNYFGIASDDLLAEVKRRWPRVIFDNTQAFFSAPRMDADSYNVYSCRKFVGVPDGAYLVHTGLTDGIYPADTSWQHAAFLFRCIDESVNSAYGDSLDNESRFDGEIRGMSPSTRRILASVEYDALRLRRRNALGLPLVNELALELRHIGKQLQDDIRDQRTRQIPAFSRIEQRHIQHHDGRAFFLCNDAPLLQNFLIIAPQTVDALDNKRIAVFQFAHQPSVLRPLEVLSGLLVHENCSFHNSKASQRNQLPLRVLFLCRYTCIPIFHFSDLQSISDTIDCKSAVNHTVFRMCFCVYLAQFTEVDITL